jgi:hypothetical protein
MRSAQNSGAALDPVLDHLSGDSIPVQPEQLCGVADAAFRSLQRARDEHLLELTPRVIVQHALVEHFLYDFFELIPHGR